MSGFWSTLDKLNKLSPLKYPSGNSIRSSGGVVVGTPPSAPVKQPMSIVPVAPAPVAPLPPSKKDSAICETAVALATSAGLPFWLREPAYQLCVRTLPHAKSLGYKSFNSLVKTLAGKIESRFMAGNKITKAPRLASKQVRGVAGKLKSTVPTTMSISPSASYGRTVRAAPAAVSVRQRGLGRPRVRSSARGMMISHSELIGNLVSAGTTLNYVSYGYVANPGKYSTFPWLCTLAGNFDKYILHSLKVHLVSNQPTSTGGKMGIAFDYDSTDPLPSDRNEFFSMTHHVECAPWDSLTLDIPLDKVPRFVNSHTETDSKLIDCGNIVVMADQVVAVATAIADIIVEYDVELLEPQQAVYTTQMYYGANLTTFQNINTVGPVISTNSDLSSDVFCELKLPQGYYRVDYYAYDAAGGTPNCVVAVHNASGTKFTNSALGSNESANSAFIKVTLPDGRVKLTPGTVALANLEKVLITVSRISAAVYTSYGYFTALTTY